MNKQPFSGKFDSLIGLSPVPPNCQQDDLTAAQITDADSPIFLTDIDSLNLNINEALDDCGPESLWQLLAAGRKNGLIAMETDLLAAFESVNTKRLQPFKGMIGEVQGMGFDTSLQEGQRVSISLQTKSLPGAFLRISKIGLVASNDVDVQVNIPGNLPAITVVCSANSASYYTLPEPLMIPLDGNKAEFSYTVSGFRPKKTKLSCDCGGQQERINQYLSGLVDAPAYGLILIADAGCNPLEAVYYAADMEPVKQKVLAVALRYISLAFAIERMLNSGIVNRYTMMGSDELYARRGEYKKAYEQRIGWLASNKGIDFSGSACYTCLPVAKQGLQKRGILS